MLKFLVIEDDPAFRRLIKQYLSPFGRCDLAYDGHEAVAIFRVAVESDSPYDLVTLDIEMPISDGHKTLESIRQIESQRGVLLGDDAVKVIMITGLKDCSHCIKAFREGCECYLTKPFDKQQLLDKISLLLGDRFPQPRSADSLDSGCSARTPPGRYLIVDDDRVCRELLADILAPHGQCDFAYNGAEAIDAVRLALEDGVPYDLICLDIMMPGTSGHDALQAIRDVEGQHGIRGSDTAKVIMTTALRDSKHCIQSFREGCESYLTKPIAEDELLARMQQLGLLPARDSIPQPT